MEQAWDSFELTRQEQLELIAVQVGLKSVLRLERPASTGQRIAAQMCRHGFACVEAGFHLVPHHRHPLGDTFVSTVPGAAVGMQRGVYFVALRSQLANAEALAQIEARTPGSPEIGRRLGYPACCIAAYEDIHLGSDWITTMLASTPPVRRGLAACNRLTRLFGEWTLLPDYYPCSFTCAVSAEWSSEIARAASTNGMESYVEKAKLMLALSIRVEEETITLLSNIPEIVRHKSGIKGERILTWENYP